MKKILYILSFVAIVTSGCADNNNSAVNVETDYASVSLSSTSAVVSEESQVHTIFVASNRSEWEVQCDADWLDISAEENSIVLYIDENRENTSRLAVIDVVAGAKPDVAKARLKLLQQGLATTNLSVEGTANCYVAKCGASYRFDASVKGNGKRDGNSRYIESCGVELSEGAYAELVWEASYDGDKTRSSQIISGEPIYNAESKEIHFTTGNNEGNASIALCDAKGEILWSWHIWVTNAEIGHSSANNLIWQDRNLGALTNEIGNISNRGMLYQWGRKDPFLPSYVEYMEIPRHKYDEELNLLETEEEYNAINDKISQVRALVNLNNTQYGDGVRRWSFVGNMAPVALQAPGNIEYSVQNPTMVLGCRNDIPIGEYVFDWYLLQDLPNSSGNLEQSQSLLWGDADAGSDYKSIFDPCPVGYAVPPRGAFGGIPEGYACSVVDDEWELSDYGWTWKGGNGDYFPSSGNFDVSGLIGETGEKILYWTAESFGAETQGFGKSAMLFEAYNVVFYGIFPILEADNAAAWYSYGARCFAAPIRCVKEQK